jgi:Right handed beta helix region
MSALLPNAARIDLVSCWRTLITCTAFQCGAWVVRKVVLLFTLLTLAVFSLLALSANAQVARTFVSAAGSDSNNCANVATPCRHLAAAYAATAANGEIYVLDPANYGSLTITGPVSIEGHGWASIAAPSGGSNPAAITINANTGDKINIIGVVLDGTALVPTTGINFNNGGSLTVRDSVIRNFTPGGIDFSSTSSSLSQFFVSNTLIADNGGNGFSAGGNSVNGVLDRVQLENNQSSGLSVGALGTINITVTDSEIAGSGANGILATALSPGATVNVMVQNSTIAKNFIGFDADGTVATISVTRSTITGNTSG